MFGNPRRGRQARNFTTNVPKILDLKSSWVPKSLHGVIIWPIFILLLGKKWSCFFCSLRWLTEELQLSSPLYFQGFVYYFSAPPPLPTSTDCCNLNAQFLFECVLSKMKFEGWIFLSALLNAWRVQFCRFLWRWLWATIFKNPSSLEGGAWMKNEMSPNDDSNKRKFLLF